MTMQALSSEQQQQQQLEDAFQVFNQVSEQLVASYQQLQSRVAQLNSELSLARSERMRQLAEKELLANRLTKLLDALPAGVILVDDAQVIRKLNPAASALLPSANSGISWQCVIDQEFLTTESADAIQTATGRIITLIEKDLAPEPGEILLILDITEKREMEVRLNRQKRLAEMGEMAAQLAHQIRTPLSSALLYTNHLGRSDLSTQQRERFSEKSRQRLRYMERQINDMLAFARGGQYDTESFDLADVLDALLQTMQPLYQAEEATIRLQMSFDSPIPMIGDADALLGAFSNLASNVLDHARRGVKLQISVTPKACEWIVVTFEDDGPGLEEVSIDRIFDPFFTTKNDGTGLGLAIVQSVIIGHKGRIAAIPSHLGGAGFEIELPLHLSSSMTRREDQRGAA